MRCYHCNAENLPNSRYCCMCGKEMKKTVKEPVITEDSTVLYSKTFQTSYRERTIEVLCQDISEYPEEIDLLIISAFQNHYEPTKGTLLHMLLEKKGILVEGLAKEPYMDLRKSVGCWISKETSSSNIHRIGCIEMKGRYDVTDNNVLTSIQSFFQMLDLLAVNGTSLGTILFPLIGTGRQGIDPNTIITPLINEALNYLKKNTEKIPKKIVLFDRNRENAALIAQALQTSYALKKLSEDITGKQSKAGSYVFLSYSTQYDKPVADILCTELEKQGIRVWYAPRNIGDGEYADHIVSAIDQCTHFVCIISEHSLKSNHVLNEIDLAFNRLKDGLTIIPFRIDKSEMAGAFRYYLNRLQWNNAYEPPLNQRIYEFINTVWR